MCLAQGHNAVTPVRLKPAALRSRVRHSTTEPVRSLYHSITCLNGCKKFKKNQIFIKKNKMQIQKGLINEFFQEHFFTSYFEKWSKNILMEIHCAFFACYFYWCIKRYKRVSWLVCRLLFFIRETYFQMKFMWFVVICFCSSSDFLEHIGYLNIYGSIIIWSIANLQASGIGL